MAGVPNDPVKRTVKHIMEGDSEIYYAQRGSVVAALDFNSLDD
jgi:hypothetical protein